MTAENQIMGMPHDKQAELALLGSVLIDNNSLNEILGSIKPNTFYFPAHQDIFQCILDLADENKPIDELLVANRLEGMNKLEEHGGFAYLAELTESVPNTANIQYYAQIIRDHSTVRDLIKTSTEIVQESRDPTKDVSELLAKAESKINELALNTGKKGYSHIQDILLENFERLEELSEKPDEVTGLPTGFVDLDKITSGLQPSDLIIVAARPAMGKTAFALNIAQYAATRPETKGAILVFSLEMSKSQLATRMLVAESKIPADVMRTGKLSDKDWDRLSLATQKLSQIPIYFNDTPAISTYELHGICKQLDKESEHGVSLVVVDYLQLMRTSKNTQSREQEIADISRTLKVIAKELNIPVIALSQLNRGLENRSEKRPQMSDIRESGAIEQDADIIMFIYRDEIYNENTPDKGIAEIAIAKHRNGATGTVRLAFIGKYAKFANYSGRED